MSQSQTRVIRTDVHHDVSPPLSELVKTAQPVVEEDREGEELKLIPLPGGFKPSGVPDPVQQPPQRQLANAVTAPLAPNVILNFDGIGQGVANFDVQFAPPDTNGAVGLTQYVQWVNVNFAVFDKATGNMLPNYPVAGNTLWQGFGGSCETNNDGDPIVMYDKLADRWIFTQFVVRNPTPPPSFGPFFQCVAVSTSSDATGSYNRYAFPYTAFDDYPKMGVWPDAYYVTFNMFSASGTTFLGADACAYDRNAMLNGQPATQVCFQQAPTVGGVLPADVDGHNPPPPGSPNYMIEFDVDSLNLYKFHVDFATPANSTFSAATKIPVAPFTPLCGGGRSCVPQPGTTTLLDSLADRVMYRLAYRNFGDHESLVVNHSVAVTVNNVAASGIRWYEIQNPNGSPTVAQQSTFAPDANYRWMGSVAMDQAGDLAVGYSVSSSTMFPSIAVAARAASDPPNNLQTPEISIFSGTGSQLGTLIRWGDYSAMQVDPSDDCTFWYTNEYLKTSGQFNWNTRVASFKFPSCDRPDLTVTSTHSGNFTQGQTGKTYTITVTNAGARGTDGSVVTVTDTLPTGLTATVINGTGWTCTLGSLTCTRNDVLAPGLSYPDITLTADVSSTAPGIITNAATVGGGGEVNTSNDTASDPTTVIQLGPDPTITKTHSGTFIQGQTGIYTITVTNAGLSPLDGTTVTVTDTLPIGLTPNAASGTGWTCVLGPPVSCTRSDALAPNVAYPAITLTVNVAANAPLSVTNTVTVAGGGNVNTFNDTATDPTKIIPPPPDLSLTKTHFGNFNQGQFAANYSLTVSNAPGSSPTSAPVTVTDTLPAGLNLVLLSGTGWPCFVTQGAITCTRNDPLPGGSSYQPLNLLVSVANDAPASVINTAVVSGGGDVTPGNNTANDPTTIIPSPDLTITKSHTDPFTVGQTGTYTITVSNIGHAPTTGLVTVNDSLPDGFVASAISGAGWSCSGNTFITCTRSDALAAAGSYPAITLTIPVRVGVGGLIVTNTANVRGGGEFITADTVNDLTHINAPVLTITKSHVGNFTAGQTGDYTITVGNAGNIATIGTPVTVSDLLPTGMTATAFSSTGWSCSGTTNVACTRSDALATNSSYPPITLTVAIDGTASALVFNVASVTGGGDNIVHLAHSDATTINVPDLAITKTHPGNFVVGQAGAAYTINVQSVGTMATVGGTVKVEDFIPTGLTAIQADAIGWVCSAVPTTDLTCSRPAGALAPGNSYPPIVVTVRVDSAAASPVTNFAKLSGIGESNPNNNFANDNTTILPAVGLTSTSPTIVVVNAGSVATFSFSASLATNPAAGTVTFSTSTLPQNSKATFSPTSLTQTGPVTLTLDTSGNGHVASLHPIGTGSWTAIYAALLFALCGLFAITRSRQKGSKSWLWAGMGVSVLALVLAFVGCGGGSGPPPPTPTPTPSPVVTPPGTYTITITATSSNNVPPATMQVTVIVK